MAKIVDITDKLTFDGNPSLKIKGKILEVNADAPTMLKIMGLMSCGDPGPEEIMKAYDLLFPEKTKQQMTDLKLGFTDLFVVIQEAVKLVTGEAGKLGER